MIPSPQPISGSCAASQTGWMGILFLPFGSEDLTSESAQQMLNVAQLVDDATDHTKRMGWVDTEGLKAVPRETGHGRFIRIGGVETWFGINFRGWARHSNTPLWLSYWKGYHEQLEKAGLATRKFEIDDRYCIPIPLPSAEHYNAALNSVVSELESIAKAFGYVGPVPDLIESDSLRSWRLKSLGPKFAERMLGLRQLVDDAARRAANHAERGRNQKWANTRWFEIDHSSAKDRVRAVYQNRRCKDVVRPFTLVVGRGTAIRLCGSRWTTLSNRS